MKAHDLDMNFSLPQRVSDFAAEVKAFVIEKVIPFEKDERWTSHGPTDDLRRELNDLARKAGVFAPHAPKEYGGRELSHIGQAAVFTAAGYSMLGPIALHCAAPDEGNMHLLDKVGRPDQREQYLKPLATGVSRSCFCSRSCTGMSSTVIFMRHAMSTPTA